MIRNLILLMLLIGPRASAQFLHFSDLNVQAIKTIDQQVDDYRDLQYLRETLKDKRVVLLGEQSHREGATFEAKSRLVRYLHQELGYDLLVFESGFYDNYKAYQTVTKQNSAESPLKESIFSIWSSAKEVELLLQYVHAVSQANPLLIAGFDFQEGPIFSEFFVPDLQQVLARNEAILKSDYEIIQQVIDGGVEFIVESQADSIEFFNVASRISKGLSAVESPDNTLHSAMIRHTFASWLSYVRYQIDRQNDVFIAVQNPRDLQMAKNLIFLSNLYPKRKIIAWGASYHFAKTIEASLKDPLTQKFVHAMDSLEKIDSPTDLEVDLAGAVPMGEILHEHFESSLFSMAFSTYQGQYGMLGMKAYPLRPIQPPAGSVEAALISGDLSIGYVDLASWPSNRWFYSSALGNIPLLGSWSKMFDGIFFISDMYPPSFARQQSPGKADAKSDYSFSEQRKASINAKQKRLVDDTSKEGISFANIYILGTSKGVATNSQGEFIFTASSLQGNERIVLSSIGYRSDTISVVEYNKNLVFALKPISYTLGAVEIRSKPLTAKEIVKKAESRITQNYIQQPVFQEFFFRESNYEEDSLFSNEEATVVVYDPDGYKPANHPTRNLKGKILQFRNTTSNIAEDMWAGVGSVWLVLTHDLVLDKSNVLHRPSYYDLNLEGIQIFEGRRVFEITFDCKRPGSFTTGFGYPSPISASGKLFIDAETYAVLRLETNVSRKPHRSKRLPHFTHDPYGHHIIQVYKQIEGKYLLSYSRQVNYGIWTNSISKTSAKNVFIREMLLTEVFKSYSTEIAIPLSSIKSAPVATDKVFWERHNSQTKDDVEKLYRFFGLKKD